MIENEVWWQSAARFILVKLQNLVEVSLIPFTSGGFKLKNVTHHLPLKLKQEHAASEISMTQFY